MPQTADQMPPTAVPNTRRGLRLSTLGAIFSAVIIILSALSLFFVGAVASETADKIAVEKQYVLVHNAIRDRQNLLARDQLGLARWDSSVAAIALDFNPTYIEEEIVASLWHDFGHERSFLVGPGYRLLMAAFHDTVDYTERRLVDSDSLRALTDLAIARHNTNRTTIPGGFGQQPLKAGQVDQIAAYGFVEIDGEPMIASAMAIVPDDGAVALPPGPPVILVSARPIDRSFIDDINAQLKLTGMTFSRDPGGFIPAIDIAGRTIGSFAWQMYLPGGDIWAVVVPLVLTLCGVLLAATLLLGRSIGRLSACLEASERRNRELAFRDALSGLANRLGFDQALGAAADRLTHAPFAVIASDLDRFKAVNDVHGHGAGDEVIRVVAERLHTAVGAYGLVGRTGGDEFVVLVTAFHDRARLALLAHEIIASVSRPIALSSGIAVDVGISLGVAVAPENGVSGHAIMLSADRALYASKDGGRGRVFFAQDLADDGDTGLEAAVNSVHAA